MMVNATVNLLGDAPSRFSLQRLPPDDKKVEHMCSTFLSSGGDGGNRTRVRKIRPTEIYERSRLIVSPQAIQSAKHTCGHSLRPEGPLSRC